LLTFPILQEKYPLLQKVRSFRDINASLNLRKEALRLTIGTTGDSLIN